MLSSAAAILGAGFLNTAGSVYTNTLNAANAARINKENVALQYAINADQIEAARMNNQTAIDLANTAHQREVRDLRDAGLNPILSTHGSGADSPSLQAPNLDAPTVQRYDQVNPLGGIASAVAGMVQADDQHKLNKLQREVLSSDIPTEGVSALRSLASQNVQSAIAQSKAEETAARLENKLTLMKESMLDTTIGRRTGTIRTGKQWESYDLGDIVGLMRDAWISELKDQGNKNWRNNLGAASSAINSGVSAGAAIKGMRRPVGRVTTLPNGKTITTKDLFK